MKITKGKIRIKNDETDQKTFNERQKVQNQVLKKLNKKNISITSFVVEGDFTVIEYEVQS